MDNVIKVFTGKSLETMFKEGGCGNWKLDEGRAAACEYVVAVRNSFALVKAAKDVDHRTAFMIGKISGILNSGDRHIIQFSEYATLEIPAAWDGRRNPVTYTSLDRLRINLRFLKWNKFPDDKVELREPSAAPLTIGEAKRGLAAALGIKTDQIEINIRA
jgi:hypothetical protein